MRFYLEDFRLAKFKIFGARIPGRVMLLFRVEKNTELGGVYCNPKKKRTRFPPIIPQILTP